jgi:hypothetical protein
MLSQKTFQESDFSGITRVAMNCQSCNTTIDYRFQTNCAHCETEQASLPLPPIQEPIASVKNRFTWTRRVVSLIYVLTIYDYFLRRPVNGPHSCGGTGEAVAVFSILIGAFLGTVGGSVVAVKNPVWK